jgi:hypothetical protein
MTGDSPRKPEYCAYRHPLETALGETQRYYCGLAQTICGVNDPWLYPVRLDECALCCRSREPHPSAPNGLVASVTYKALLRINEAGGMDGCSAERAKDLVPWAKSHFTVVSLSELVARRRGAAAPYTGPCQHLGEQAGQRLCKTCRGQVRLKVFICNHAAHASTVIRECMACPDYSVTAEEATSAGGP